MILFFLNITTLYYFLLTFSLNVINPDICKSEDIKYPVNDTLYFTAEINEKSVELTEGYGKIKNGSNSLKTLKKEPDSSLIIFQSFFYKYPAGQAEITISIGTLKFKGFIVENTNFIDFFGLKKYSYSVLAENGVEITYRDKKDQLWKTSRGSQENSSFEITEIKSDSSNVKFKALFSCKLYNSEGELKNLTKGVFIGYFRNN